MDDEKKVGNGHVLGGKKGLRMVPTSLPDLMTWHVLMPTLMCFL